MGPGGFDADVPPGPPLWLFVAVALGAAVAFALLGNLILERAFDQEVHLIPSLITSALVGLFVAGLILGRRRRPPEVQGFDVDDVRRL